jgi:Cytochrome c554 and c-prime
MRRSTTLRVLAPFLLIVPVLSSSPAGAAQAKGSAAGLYSPARLCSSCHQAIHKAWADSAHARSASSPLFQETLRAAAAGSRDAATVRRDCVWCHAPTTILTGDVDLKDPISNEGITCDFCHTVADVDMDRAGHPFDSQPGKVKRGPLQYNRTPAHQTLYSSLHRVSPLLCAACHELTNAQGIAVLSTYSEWKAGPYPARGVPCQECHMALVPGSIVREDLKGQSLRVVNLHRLVGGGSSGQLRRGLDLKIDSVSEGNGSARVLVVVTNVAAGHAVPGGLSTKSLVLAVGVDPGDGSLQHRQERIYHRELKDADGIVLSTVADLFLKAASVGEDTRLKPRESRTERFSVPIPSGAKAIVARLEYVDASDPKGGSKTSLVTEVRRDLTAR